MDAIRPNFRDFEVELEALQMKARDSKDAVEKHVGVKDRIEIDPSIEIIQNRI